LRLKSRRDRRTGLKLENPWVFYPRLLAETLGKAWGYYRAFRQAKTILKEVLAGPDRWTYRDLAITPPDESSTTSIFTTRPMAARMRWPESAVRTQSASGSGRAFSS